MPFIRFLKYIKNRSQGFPKGGSTVHTSAPKAKKGKAPTKKSLKGPALNG
jgi:hypothetical protein